MLLQKIIGIKETLCCKNTVKWLFSLYYYLFLFLKIQMNYKDSIFNLIWKNDLKTKNQV